MLGLASSHGTSVAGIISGQRAESAPGKGDGLTGVAPDARLMVFGTDSTGDVIAAVSITDAAVESVSELVAALTARNQALDTAFGAESRARSAADEASMRTDHALDALTGATREHLDAMAVDPAATGALTDALAAWRMADAVLDGRATKVSDAQQSLEAAQAAADRARVAWDRWATGVDARQWRVRPPLAAAPMPTTPGPDGTSRRPLFAAVLFVVGAIVAAGEGPRVTTTGRLAL
jgi:hypothetical protein